MRPHSTYRRRRPAVRHRAPANRGRAPDRRLAGARATYRPEVLGGIGAFAGFFRVPPALPRARSSCRRPTASGTKLKVAFLAGRHDTVGIDLVAMGVNDLLVHGAEPLYLPRLHRRSTASIPRAVEAVVRGIAAGCREAGCALVGGETAELPDFYAPGEYDLAGLRGGRRRAQRASSTGRGVRPGDARARARLDRACTRTATAWRARSSSSGSASGRRPRPRRSAARRPTSCSSPTRIYVKPVLALLRAGVPVRAMAHITGGGLTGNLPRVLPAGCRAVIDRGTWPVPAGVPRGSRRRGRIDEAEMFRRLQHGHRLRPRGAAPARGARARQTLAGRDAGVPDRGDPPGRARGDVPLRKFGAATGAGRLLAGPAVGSAATAITARFPAAVSMPGRRGPREHARPARASAGRSGRASPSRPPPRRSLEACPAGTDTRRSRHGPAPRPPGGATIERTAGALAPHEREHECGGKGHEREGGRRSRRGARNEVEHTERHEDADPDQEHMVVLPGGEVVPVVQPGDLREVVGWPKHCVHEQKQLEREPEGQARGDEHEADVQVVDLVGCELRHRSHAFVLRPRLREENRARRRPSQGRRRSASRALVVSWPAVE